MYHARRRLTYDGHDMSDHEPADHQCERLALLRQVIDHHAPALELFARQWCATPEDVVQEAMVKLAMQHPLPDDPVAWLYTVVRRGAIDALRSARRRQQRETAAAEHRRSWFTPVNGQSLDVDDAAAALQSLDHEHREVVVAHLWGGLTFEAIAHVTGSSPSTAHRRYVAALHTLRAQLNGQVKHDE